MRSIVAASSSTTVTPPLSPHGRPAAGGRRFLPDSAATRAAAANDAAVPSGLAAALAFSLSLGLLGFGFAWVTLLSLMQAARLAIALSPVAVWGGVAATAVVAAWLGVRLGRAIWRCERGA